MRPLQARRAIGPVTVLAVAALAGCNVSLSAPDGGTGDGGETGIDGAAGLRAQLVSAKSTWAAAKSGCATYSYNRRWMSVFGGAALTTVEVRDDVPTRRRYATISSPPFQPDPGTDWVTVWDEMGSEVGQHATTFPVFPASTVEELQDECASVLARDPATNTLSLVIDARGVPMTCTYSPSGCADDCLGGITIVGFACAPLLAADGAN